MIVRELDAESDVYTEPTVCTYRKHVMIISRRVDTPPFGVRFVDVPEAVSGGQTLDDAFVNACAALDRHLESLQKLNLPVPEPRHRLTIELTEEAAVVLPRVEAPLEF